MYDYVRTYKTARAFFAALEVGCYVVVAIGGVLALVGFSHLGGGQSSDTLNGFTMIIAGIFLAMLAFFGIAMTQVSRAVIDSAECSREMLEIARGTKEPTAVSEPVTSREPVDSVSTPNQIRKEADELKPDEGHEPFLTREYMGRKISRKGKYYFVAGMDRYRFIDIASAEAHIAAVLAEE